MRVLVVGHGGREAALASAIARTATVCAFAGHENPTLVRLARRTGGDLRTGRVTDGAAVAAYAREAAVDLALVSSDEPLAAGVVDALLAAGIETVGPTREGARIEWDKAFSRALVDEVAPQLNPVCVTARDAAALDGAFADFGTAPVAVKPLGLTGGKGVKVMGPHLDTHADARAYAHELLDRDGGVLVEERIDGIEVTIQAISDGHTVVFPPATYDYPYRFDGDTGPGTGGMGSFSHQARVPPFVTREEYRMACAAIEAVIARLTADGRRFNGVMNSGFFVRDDGGLSVIEFNARFGDPECLNIMALLDGDFVALLQALARGTLHEQEVRFRPGASLVAYGVSPDYALRAGEPREFSLDEDELTGCQVLFSSSVAQEDHYRTLGTSRAVALVATAPTLDEAHGRIEAAIGHVHGPLQWRHEIGAPSYVDALTERRFGRMRPRVGRRLRIAVVGQGEAELALLERLRAEGVEIVAEDVAPDSPHAAIAAPADGALDARVELEPAPSGDADADVDADGRWRMYRFGADSLSSPLGAEGDLAPDVTRAAAELLLAAPPAWVVGVSMPDKALFAGIAPEDAATLMELAHGGVGESIVHGVALRFAEDRAAALPRA